jgi:hypothetical protein
MPSTLHFFGLIFSGEKVKLSVLRFYYKAGKYHHLGHRTPPYTPLGANRNFSMAIFVGKLDFKQF